MKTRLFADRPNIYRGDFFLVDKDLNLYIMVATL